MFSLKKGFKCPHHNCVKCGRGNGQAGGLLLRCTECPIAFCEDCEPKTCTHLDSGDSDRFQDLGMWCSSARVGLWRSLENAKSFD